MPIDLKTKHKHQQLGEYLIERGLVTRESVDAAIREGHITNERIGNIFSS